MATQPTLTIAEAREGVASVSVELGALLKTARVSTKKERREARMADRIAELKSALGYVAAELKAARERSPKLPCLRCGSRDLPEKAEWPVCPDCGAVHGTCPVCGDDVVGDEPHCIEGGDDD